MLRKIVLEPNQAEIKITATDPNYINKIIAHLQVGIQIRRRPCWRFNKETQTYIVYLQAGSNTNTQFKEQTMGLVIENQIRNQATQNKTKKTVPAFQQRNSPCLCCSKSPCINPDKCEKWQNFNKALIQEKNFLVNEALATIPEGAEEEAW
jgi:hypothetical protein